MSRFHSCKRCSAPGVEPDFAYCGKCMALMQEVRTLTAEQQALASLAEIRQAEDLRLERAWEAHRLSLTLREFPGGLANPQPH
ncbi:MAG: hypothetical protein ACXVB2_19715 [Isosphaeraceae bacterium]